MKRIAAWSVGLLSVPLLATAGAVYFYPFQTATAVRELRLRASGTRRARLAGGLEAWEKDSCRDGAPCRCLALVHGLGDSALTWDKVLEDPRAGAPGLRLVAVDMPGTEGSAPPPDAAGYAIPEQARALKGALAPLCRSWTVAGNSLGGWTALTLARDWPAGVRRLVLLDAAGVDDPTGTAERSARALEDPTVASLKDFDRRARWRVREIPARAWTAAVAAIRRRPTRATVLALRRADLLDRALPALSVPTTILWGEADGIIPLSAGEKMHRLIRGSVLKVLPRCGHLPQQECPRAVQDALFGAPEL